MKQCRKCLIEKPLDEFSPLKKHKDGKHSYCKSCMSAIMKQQYHKNPTKKAEADKRYKERVASVINKIKTEQGCKFCSEREPICLDFHHLNPKIKDREVSFWVRSKSLNKALLELEQCVCVCSNCHRKIHAGIIKLNGAPTEQ